MNDETQYPTIWTTGPCTVCHAQFTSPHTSDRTCSDKCSKQHQTRRRRNKRNRAKQRIYNQNNNQCQLCGRKVDLTSTHKHWRPSLDHIRPKSKGGPNETRNLQLTHALCNTYKGNHTGQHAINRVHYLLKRNHGIQPSKQKTLTKLKKHADKLNTLQYEQRSIV